MLRFQLGSGYRPNESTNGNRQSESTGGETEKQRDTQTSRSTRKPVAHTIGHARIQNVGKYRSCMVGYLSLQQLNVLLVLRGLLLL